jgi:5-methylcytosine-specific restriction endonuclease McrA
MTLTCEHCGIEFERRKGGGPPATYCTQNCRARAADARKLARGDALYYPSRRVHIRDCDYCGKTYVGKTNLSRFCADNCKKLNRYHNGSGKGEQAQRYANRRNGEKSGCRMAPEDLAERDGWVCALCDHPIDPKASRRSRDGATIDHILAIALGGKHEADNLQLAHQGCNARKGARVA